MLLMETQGFFFFFAKTNGIILYLDSLNSQWCVRTELVELLFSQINCSRILKRMKSPLLLVGLYVIPKSIHGSASPSKMPTVSPTVKPSLAPTFRPTTRPPTPKPTKFPTSQPSGRPSRQPINHPSGRPTRQPSSQVITLPYPFVQDKNIYI